jgi:hypothetical protein
MRGNFICIVSYHIQCVKRDHFQHSPYKHCYLKKRQPFKQTPFSFSKNTRGTQLTILMSDPRHQPGILRYLQLKSSWPGILLFKGRLICLFVL